MIACHECCSECQGPENTQCDIDQCDQSNTCYPLANTTSHIPPGEAVESTICLYMCEHPTDNLFLDTSHSGQEICRTCHSNCKICYGSEVNTCLECIPPKLLTNEKECLYEDCVAYPNTFEADIMCEKCITKCKECQFSPSNCLDCEPPYVFFTETNSCLDTCPDQFYGNRTMGITECQSIYIYIYIFI